MRKQIGVQPFMKKIIAIVLLMGWPGVMNPSTALQPDKPPANRRNFVACPIVRDTKTMPCWLAEYEGELYYLGQQGSSVSEFYPPQLNHEVLVEGTIASDRRVCGGIPLNPVRVSVIAEINRACNTLLPAEEGLEPLPPPPRRSVDLLRQQGTDTSAREFVVPFDFDSDYLTLHTTRIVGEAARVAKAIKAAKVEVAGYRATTWLSNGRRMVEAESIASQRAEKVGEILVGLGLPAASVSVQARTEPEPCDGVTDPDKRRVTIRIIP
jgi:outer membrane protein OmpA-like peptidoglycan-associated protein